MKVFNIPLPLVSVFALLGVLVVPGSAFAMPVQSSNPIIALGADIYIPITPETSGMLGELVGMAPYQHIVGLDPDSITLSAADNTTSGYVSLIADFDLSGDLAGGMIIDPNSDLPLGLVFADLDFNPVSQLGGQVVFREWLDLLLVDADGVAIAGANQLTIDSANYLNFRQDVDGSGQQIVETDNVIGTYEMTLASMFAGDNAARSDFIDLLNEEQTLGLKLTFHAEIDYFGSGRVRFNNSPENMDDASLVFSVAPEPGTICLLLFGGVGLGFKARRNLRHRASN